MTDPDGEPQTAFAIFVVTFIMLVSWVLLQLSTVVLIDGFTRASARIEHEEEQASRAK